ncbi:MAG: carboxypeptidase regulatory-like domain-containing protein, partial [Acidobacteria bacterium]|nr:carboxypeptidase regulatory-like domain-containing protein [Acidobacteriota bacterium]
MLIKRDRIDNLRVASPCPVSWDEMQGDERKRFCEECKLHVYNISEMTRRQAEALIASTEGRLCARLYRRADGTVMTKDCPIGLRALRRRMSKVAGAAVTAIFSLCMSAMGQNPAQADKSQQSVGQQAQVTTGQLQGIVRDSNGAVVAGAAIQLINEKTKQRRETTSNDEGFYRFSSLEAGSYTIVVSATGFEVITLEHVAVRRGVVNDATVDLAGLKYTHEVFVGIIAEDTSLLSGTGLGNKTVFSPKQITRLP